MANKVNIPKCANCGEDLVRVTNFKGKQFCSAKCGFAWARAEGVWKVQPK